MTASINNNFIASNYAAAGREYQLQAVKAAQLETQRAEAERLRQAATNIGDNVAGSGSASAPLHGQVVRGDQLYGLLVGLQNTKRAAPTSFEEIARAQLNMSPADEATVFGSESFIQASLEDEANFRNRFQQKTPATEPEIAPSEYDLEIGEDGEFYTVEALDRETPAEVAASEYANDNNALNGEIESPAYEAYQQGLANVAYRRTAAQLMIDMPLMQFAA